MKVVENLAQLSEENFPSLKSDVLEGTGATLSSTPVSFAKIVQTPSAQDKVSALHSGILGMIRKQVSKAMHFILAGHAVALSSNR